MADDKIYSFKENKTYQAKVKAQALNYGKDDKMILCLTVTLEGELVNDFKPEAGCLAVPAGLNVDVNLGFPHDNEEQMGFSMDDLQRLGFTGDDLELLNPASKKPHLFAGKTVYVACKKKMYNDSERFYWNLRNPLRFADRPVAKGEASKSPAAKAFKDLLAKKKLEGSTPTLVPGGKDIPF